MQTQKIPFFDAKSQTHKKSFPNYSTANKLPQILQTQNKSSHH